MMSDDLLQERRNDYDVTNTVQVSSTAAVRGAVRELFQALYPLNSFDPLWIAFHDFQRYFEGSDAAYHAVDTTYHDIQHTLDMTLALARFIAGYEESVAAKDRLGAERAQLALVTALFHDSGYLRHRVEDRGVANGAQFTLTHVSRSARFLRSYLPKVGLEHAVAVASQIVHFTGYEMDVDEIELDDPLDATVGHLLGTADLVAQLADRCYLEKCRDRLYPEFVLGGIAVAEQRGGTAVRYRSGRDLLRKTLEFYQRSARRRLEHTFNRAYRYAEAVFDGHNPYTLFIHRNLHYLATIVAKDQWGKLRRHPVCVLPDSQGEARIMALALGRLRTLAAQQKMVLRSGRPPQSVPSAAAT
jgi:hypothetical protein